MATTNQARRKYKISDDVFIEESRTKRGFFLEDKTDFIAFDSDFDDPFGDEWLEEIDTAEEQPSDEILDDQSSQLTAAVEAQMVLCRGKFQDTKYFIEKAFPANQPVWNEFGYNNYEKARRSQSLMIPFMKKFHGVCVKYKTQMNAAGLADPAIATILTLAGALDTANNTQEIFIGKMPVETQTRVNTYNTAWDTLVKVCSAGKIIFKNNYAKFQQYLLPAGEESADQIQMSGLITDADTGNPLAGVLVSAPDLGIETLTGDDGLYAFGGIPDGSHVLLFVLDGYENQEHTATITDGAGVVINVQMNAV